eukprot:1372790-Amorphochlora_amoeboformis.AAC.1
MPQKNVSPFVPEPHEQEDERNSDDDSDLARAPPCLVILHLVQGLPLIAGGGRGGRRAGIRGSYGLRKLRELGSGPRSGQPA